MGLWNFGRAWPAVLMVLCLAGILSCRRSQSADIEAKPAAKDAAQSLVAKLTGPAPDGYTGRWMVFVVPGTYDNASAWFHVLPDQATFSSELQRVLGDKATVQPFHWRSSIHHAVREKAAQNLAQEIDEKSTATDRVVLVGYSHGGNVALLAAAQCKHKIDTVICLSTPIVYYRMQQADEPDKNRFYELPVYCPPETCANVGRILTVTPQTDDVPEYYADLRKGLDENEALHATRHWRDTLKTLSLRDDGSAYRELLEDILSTRLVNQVQVNAHLNVAQHNIVYPSTVPDERGQGAHRAVHSRRMGAVLGILIKRRCDADSLEFLQSFTQRADCDCGEPIAESAYRAWEREHEADLEHSGWLLKEAVVKSSFTWDREWHPVGSDPDPYFTIGLKGAAAPFKSSVIQNSLSAKWEDTICVVPRNAKWEFNVHESNPLEDKLVGSAEIYAGANGPPTQLKGPKWSAELTWVRVHE